MKSVIKGITLPVLGMVLMIAITILSTSCDNHEPIDRDMHVGYVLCNDHSCMDTASYFNQTKRKAVGVVFAEKTDATLPWQSCLMNSMRCSVIPWVW